MLALSRSVNETVRIGTDITISVIEIRGNRVVLGFDAPGQVKILRGEIVRDERELEERSINSPKETE